MKPFPYDEFKPVFMEELKDLFVRFIEWNRDKKPYAFVLAAGLCTVCNEAGALSDVEFYALWAGGNTVVDFDAKGECSAAELMSNLKALIARREEEGIAFEEQSEKLRREIFKSDKYPIAMEEAALYARLLYGC